MRRVFCALPSPCFIALCAAVRRVGGRLIMRTWLFSPLSFPAGLKIGFAIQMT